MELPQPVPLVIFELGYGHIPHRVVPLTLTNLAFLLESLSPHTITHYEHCGVGSPALDWGRTPSLMSCRGGTAVLSLPAYPPFCPA